MKIFRNIVFLVIHFLPSTHAVGQPNEGLSSVLVEEGKLAEISCVTNAGSQSEYFWRKGESLHNSTDIAFFISGLPTDKSGRFEVTKNGTLIVKKVTLADEGKYICRVSSEESDCHGEVFVFVKAVLQDFQLTIENCEPENSCVISTESNKQTSLTCKATNASPSMKLKWFNGSHEIKDNIQENSLTKGPSTEISSTIRNVYKAPSTLTCQAVDFKTSNDDGMFAHVQFRTPASTEDISPGWIVTAILFIVGFVILFLFVIFNTVWPKIRKGETVETQNSPERESLLKANNDKLEADLKTKDDAIKKRNGEITILNADLKTKDDEIKKKNYEITILNTNLKTKDEEIKTKSEDITKLKTELIETKADKRVDESNVTNKDKDLLKLEKSLETVKGQLLKKNEDHQTQKDILNKKDLEIQILQSKLEHVQEQLTKIQNHEQEISSKEGKLSERETKIKGREFEMNSIESKLTDRETNVKRREDDMKSKEKTLKIRENNMDLTEKGLRECEDNVKRREEHLNSRESSLRIQANNIKKREDELNPKENTLVEREAETKKQLLDLERKTRKFRLDLMASKDPIRINCKLIASRTGDNARVSKKEKGGQAKVTAKVKWNFKPKDAKFHTIYQTSAEPKDVCQSINDLIENAIDGRNSCLIAHDGITREHWTTMFGPDEGASDALVPYAITKIFKRSKELKTLGYEVDVTAKFKTTSTEFNFAESVNNEQTALELLKKGQGNFDQVDGSTDHLVQFFIRTETEQETLTGTLVLGTIGSIQTVKECFLSEEPKTQLTQNMSAIISDGRCRSVLITHIHEDKVDETRDCLAMVNAISKKNKK